MTLDSRRIPNASESEDITVDVNSSTNLRLQKEADTMDIDEDLATNPQTPAEKYGRMTLRGDKKIGGGNVSLPQIHKLRLKGPQLKPLPKGKKRGIVEDDEETEEGEDGNEDEDEDEEVEEDEEMVCCPTQTHSQQLKDPHPKAFNKISGKTQTTSLSIF